MGKSILQKIIRKTGRKPSICKCEACRKQCSTPCLGTPDDILQLIEAGYQDKLAVTYWCVGLVLGQLSYPIVMVQAIQQDKGGCIFYHDGLCDLHAEGLKPTEGRLSHHTITKENFTFRNGLTYNVAKEWLDKDNSVTIKKIFSYFDISMTTG